MAIYQFLIAVRSANGAGGQATMLTNAEGETTSHIQGLFNRTIRFLTEGIRPVYVFDGKPPNIKSGELGKRKEKREKAEAALKVHRRWQCRRTGSSIETIGPRGTKGKRGLQKAVATHGHSRH
jgi:5'-3' exonuclease